MYTENKARTQWDNVQSVAEAKFALKTLFDLLVDSKKELQNQSEKTYKARYEQVKEMYDRLTLEFEASQEEFKTQLARALPFEEKVC